MARQIAGGVAAWVVLMATLNCACAGTKIPSDPHACCDEVALRQCDGFAAKSSDDHHGACGHCASPSLRTADATSLQQLQNQRLETTVCVVSDAAFACAILPCDFSREHYGGVASPPPPTLLSLHCALIL